MPSTYIILHALLTRILSQIKFIVCVAAFPLPKKFRVQPSFFREPFLYQYNLCCLFVCSGDHMGSPLQNVAYITFGCRGRRPRRPVRCSSNNAVMLIINSSFRVIFSYREHPLQHRRVLNPSPAELPCYNS